MSDIETVQEPVKQEEPVKPPEPEVLTCDKCGLYQGDKNQVRGHKVHCKGKPVEPLPVPEPQSPERRERIPFGVPQRKFSIPPKDGFRYRVFNDNWAKEPDRIKRAMQAGYTRVEGHEPISVGANDDGSSIKGVLMRIPEQFYEEDQKLKQKEPDRIDQAIRGGKLQQQADDKRYIPDGIKIWSSNNENR